MKILQPDEWAPSRGYVNGVSVPAGEMVFVAGQVGWDAQQNFQSLEMSDQFLQALRNIVRVVKEAGGTPEHICRITGYCTNRAAYRAARQALGAGWKEIMGRHYPAMTMIFINELAPDDALIELEATAVIPPLA
jgi:enamine deaminase RidA (YjgF/YER057c/UK114 family)